MAYPTVDNDSKRKHLFKNSKRKHLFKKRECLLAVAFFVHCILLLAKGRTTTQSNPNEDVEKMAKTPNNNRKPVCNILFGDNIDQYPSTSSVWRRLLPRIRNASYFPANIAKLSSFRHWVGDLLEFHTEERLRKTATHPPSSESMEAILEILEKRFRDCRRHGQKNCNNADASSSEPLRIVVVGGSVTYGVNCGSTPLDPAETKDMVSHSELGFNWKGDDCAWPARLEHLLNEVFFDGWPVVEVTSMAAGGSSSEIGALIMEYQLFPNVTQLPHVVVASYGPNDFRVPDHNTLFHRDIQDFCQHAKTVRPCDERLPLVVLADHYYGVSSYRFNFSGGVTTHHLVSGYYSIVAEWYNIMAFNHRNIARHEILGNFDNKTAVAQLMGSSYDLHMGMGFHIGMAWTALFNFLNGIVETCNDMSAHDNSRSSSGRIDPLLTTPSIKYLPKLGEGGEGSIEPIVKNWKERDEQARSRCDAIRASNSSMDSFVVCPFAFMIGKGTIQRVKELNAKVKPFLKSTNGWMARGRPERNPRTGWYARQANASFEMRFPIEIAPVQKLTVVSMKSYGGDWIGSKVKLELTIIRHSLSLKTSEPNAATYEILGYHSMQTSVHFPHKFDLPGSGATIGDVVVLKANLVGGSMFKINGMALCRF